MLLKKLLTVLDYQTTSVIDDGLDVTRICFDSRKVIAASLFVAVKGTQVDGHDYIDKAIANGAKVIVLEQYPTLLQEGIIYLQVDNTALALGNLASIFYERPSHDVQLVGVTGTNGKTSTATLLFRLFRNLGYSVGLLSTVENRIDDTVLDATHTTPDAVQLQALLAEMRDAGCEYVFMEVSSHAIHQYRIAGTKFVGGIFTNITHDHLDYHGTFKNYIEAKKMFFDQLPLDAFALTNIDDKRGEVMLQNTMAKKYSYALRRPADFKVKIIEHHIAGLVLDIDGQELHTRLAGDFNAYNLLAVYAAAILLGADKMEVLQAASQLKTAEGRFDYVLSPHRHIMGIVDYAHTPDALEKVLQAIDRLKRGNEKIITVVGCGGDRDRAKRPTMAKIACDYSQKVILTSDNPRTEEPEAILEDMQKGIPLHAVSNTLVIVNRREAIKEACRLADTHDIILVAGKGHEKYQDIMGKKYPFDDKEELQKAFEEIIPIS